MLPSRQVSKRTMANLLSFVTHRVTKDAGLGFSPPSQGGLAVEPGDGGAVDLEGALERGGI
jgi:hypothetical protein